MIKPWITPYAGERFEGTFGFDGEKIFYPPGVGEPRDERGVLWQPAPENTEGAIWWKEMHTGRQRRARTDTLCQVCGKPIETTPIPWLIPNIEVRTVRPNGRPFRTVTPPTCGTCVEVARAQCPNLKSATPLLVEVRHFRPWGVFGDVVEKDRRMHQADVQFDTEAIARTMARHLVVEITDYRKARS